MNTATFMVMVMVFIAIIMGMTGFANDIATGHGKTQNSNLSRAVNGTLDSFNNTAYTLANITSGQGSWVTTAYSVFFTLPASLLSNLLSIPLLTTGLVSDINAETAFIIPSWVITIISVVITITVVLIVVSIIFNRSDT